MNDEVVTTPARPEPQYTRKLCDLMYAVQYSIKRPTARPVISNAVVEIGNGEDRREVKKGETTAPRWKADIHPVWQRIDRTATLLKKVIDGYSVCDVFRGARLVPQDQWDELRSHIDDVKKQRHDVVDEYIAKLDTEVLPSLLEKYPDDYPVIVKCLPSAKEAHAKFAIYVEHRPFVEPRGSDSETQQMFEQMARDRFNGVLESISGQVLEVCTRIETGVIGGVTRENQISSIMEALGQVERFKAFTGTDMMQHLYAAKQVLQSTNAQDINRSDSVRRGIAQAFAPLRRAAQELSEQAVGEGRVSRSINL